MEFRGPVAGDTALCIKIARQNFVKDSIEARNKAREKFPVSDTKTLAYPGKKVFMVNGEYHPSFLSNHQLKAQDYPQLKKVAPPDFYVQAYIFLSITLAILVFYNYRSRIKTLFNALFFNRFIGIIIREENLFTNRTHIALSLIALLNIGLFLSYLLPAYGLEIPFYGASYLDSWVLSLLVACIFAGKVVLLRILGFIFQFQRLASEVIFGMFLFNQALGMFLLPLLILLEFSDLRDSGVLLLGGALMAVLVFLMRVFRLTTQAFANPKISLYYLFLYLCTLEFLPLVLAWKVVSG